MQHFRIFLIALMLGCTPLAEALAWGGMGSPPPSTPPRVSAPPPVHTSVPAPVAVVTPPPRIVTPVSPVTPGALAPAANPPTPEERQALVNQNTNLTNQYWQVKAQVDATNDLADLVVKSGSQLTQAQQTMVTDAVRALQNAGHPNPSVSDIRFELQQRSMRSNEQLHTIDQTYNANKQRLNIR
jgi:hypothetical protein